jgi:hypothetical protein
MITGEGLRAAAEIRIGEALSCDPICRFGRIVRSNGEILHASGIRAPIGSRCLIDTEGAERRPAEVVGFDAGSLLIMPEQGTRGVVRGARVHVESRAPSPLVGDALLGRVIDARGMPLDGGPVPDVIHPWPLFGMPINPMSRARIITPFDVGVSAINALATMGRGMRIGLFAGSGVGKTTLLGMMAQHARADIVVVGMIGERGREIREYRLGPPAQHRGGVGRRRYRPRPSARGLSRRRHRRVLAQSGASCPARDRQPDPRRHGAARDRPRRRRAAGHQGLPALGVWRALRLCRTRRQRP